MSTGMDYTYPSIFFSYFLFFMFLVGGVFFCVRSLKRGYWGRDSEDVKYHVFEDGEGPDGR